MGVGASRGLTSLRDRNRSLVVDVLRQEGGVSQAELSRLTGLSRTTVSTLIGELRAGGFVAELEVPDASRAGGTQGGRPPVLLMLARRFTYRPSHPGVKFVTMNEMADDFAQRFPYTP